jgi:hypothetical protein
MIATMLPNSDTPHSYLRRAAQRFVEVNPGFTLLDMADGEGALYLLIQRPDRKTTCKMYVFHMESESVVYGLYGEDAFPYRNDCPAEMLAELSPVDELYDLPICREQATAWRAMHLSVASAVTAS